MAGQQPDRIGRLAVRDGEVPDEDVAPLVRSRDFVVAHEGDRSNRLAIPGQGVNDRGVLEGAGRLGRWFLVLHLYVISSAIGFEPSGVAQIGRLPRKCFLRWFMPSVA